MNAKAKPNPRGALVCAAALIAVLTTGTGLAQAQTPPSSVPANPPGSAKATGTEKDAPAHPSASPYAPDRFAGRAGLYYALNWGIDSLTVKLVESGELVRFSYRVVDPNKARVLNDKQAEATLEDPKAGVSLVIPTMEKVGQLRQTTTPQAGRSYWMAFSNKSRQVARGDRVDVVIGPFRANNLVVD